MLAALIIPGFTLFVSFFKESSCTESFCSDHVVSVQKFLLHWFVHVDQLFCELSCVEHPLNYCLELQRTEFDELEGGGASISVLLP